jgi:hypothetical protein
MPKRSDTLGRHATTVEELPLFLQRAGSDQATRPARRRGLRRRPWQPQTANCRRHRKRRARVEHALARLKHWRVLRDHRRRGRSLAQTLAAVAFLHNLRIVMRHDIRDSS